MELEIHEVAHTVLFECDDFDAANCNTVLVIIVPNGGFSHSIFDCSIPNKELE